MKKSKQILLMAVVFSFLSTFGFADTVTEPESLPPSMQELTCADLLTWLKAAAPNVEQEQSLRQQNYQTVEKIRRQIHRQGMAGRRAYAQGNRVFEDLLAMLASGYPATTIEQRVAKYVDPAFDAAKEVADLARAIHEAPPDQRAPLVQQYVHASSKFGRLYSRYSMVMGTLISVASNKGISNVADIPQMGNDKNLNASTVVYDLTSPRAAVLAKKIIEGLDDENMHKGMPNLGQAVDATLDAAIYPSFAAIQTIYRNNLYAILANSQWELAQQNYSSKPWVWFMQFLADTTVNSAVDVTGKVPAPLRGLVRTLTGLWQSDSMLSRYLPDLIDVVGITRFANEKGDMIITTDTQYMDLQLQRLFNSNASTPNNELLTTLARLLWHTQTWANIVEHVAQKAGVTNLSAWLPKALQNQTNTNQDQNSAAKSSPSWRLWRVGDETLIRPAKVSNAESPSQLQASQLQASQLQASQQQASQQWAYDLVQLLNAEKQARKLGPIPFTEPRTKLVAMRFALVNVGWFAVGHSLYAHWPTVHQYWLALYQHVLQPLLPFLH